jgi:hypothetical protein
MYFQDHNPPHFHAIYGDEQSVFDIRTLEIIEGNLSKRAVKLVREWAELHRIELEANWASIQSSGQYSPIAPLE